MRAAVFFENGGPEVLRIEDVETPEPGPGEVRVAVRAASLNHLDLWVRRGLPFEIPMPHIGGSDLAGVVDAVGPGAEHVPIGTRVVVDPSLDYDWYDDDSQGDSIERRELRLIGEHTQGGFAEFCTVPADNLLEIPEHVSFEMAGSAGLTFVTAWHGLMVQGGLRAGERVLITGASGGVSTAAVQIARLAGAKVFAVTSGAENVGRVEKLGADVVYDRLEVDYGRQLHADTGKKGVHLVLDSVGEATWTTNVRALGVRGRLVAYGATTGPKGEADIRMMFWKKLTLMGSTMGSPKDFRTVMGLMFDGKLAPVVHEVMPLDEVRRAHELLEEGKVFGKLVLTP